LLFPALSVGLSLEKSMNLAADQSVSTECEFERVVMREKSDER